MKQSFILILLSIMLSCSKNSDDSDNEEIARPKTMALSYSSGEDVVYEFSYNSENQIEHIRIERSSDGDINYLESNFNYGINGELIEVLSTFDESELRLSFSYDNAIITDINFIIDGTESDMDIFYLGDATNAYSINGDLGNLPTAWNFDSENRLEEYAVSSTNIIPTYSNFNKGIFYDVNLQPAIHIWHGLVFYLAPWELYFFSKSDIESLKIEDDTYSYKNKLWDGDGNLVAFHFGSEIPFGFTIHYTITYENKTL